MRDNGSKAGIDRRVGQRFGDYILEDQVGRGGMGVVFRARHTLSGQVVALKLMAPDLADNASFRDRFILEAEAGPSLGHPNIVHVFESGSADGELFIAMELIEGTDLKGLIQHEGRLDPKRALSIFQQAASALDAAHESGLVHRDVKPQNILVVPRESPQGIDRVYLTDFGLVRPVTSETSASRTGQIFGSVAYMAPELIEGIPADGRADVYALGCVLYESLTGKVPFERDNEISAVWAHIHEDPPLLTDTCRDLPGGLNDVLFKAMAKHPDDRFMTAGEFVQELGLGLGRKLSNLKYKHVRPLVKRIPRRKTEREVWSPNFFPELSRVREASREPFPWRKAIAFATAGFVLLSVQVGREGGLPRAVTDVAKAASTEVPRLIQVLGSEEEGEGSDQRSAEVSDERLDKSSEAPPRGTKVVAGAPSAGEGLGIRPQGGRDETATAPGAASGGGVRNHADLISFASDADGDYEIYVVGSDGNGLTKLTDNEVDDFDASWSPDGQWLVFARGSLGGSGNTDLHVMRWDGSDVRAVTKGNERETSPSWSSTGLIAFSRRTSVLSIKPDGSSETLINDRALNPEWSPDGSSIAYIRPFSITERQRIWTMRADGSQATVLTDGSEEGDEFDPSWSPDGKTIALWVDDPVDGARVALSDMTGRTTPVVPGFAPDWSPDGRGLVFETNDLEVIKPDGTERRVLLRFSVADDIQAPAWRPAPTDS